MSAREKLLRMAIVAYLSEIVAGQQIGNNPEIAIAELLPFRSFVQHRPQQSVLQREAVPAAELRRDILLPRIDAIAGILIRLSHQRRLVGEGRGEQFAQRLVERGGIAAVRRLDKTPRHVLEQQTRIARGVSSAPVGPGLIALVQRRAVDLGHRPAALGRKPAQAAVADKSRQIERAVVVETALGHRQRPYEHSLARQGREVERRSAPNGRIAEQQALGFPLGMSFEHIGMGHARRIGTLVVEPQIEPLLLGGMHEAVENGQFVVAAQIIVRIDIRGHAPIAVIQNPSDHRILRALLARHAVSVHIHPVTQGRVPELLAQGFRALRGRDVREQKRGRQPPWFHHSHKQTESFEVVLSSISLIRSYERTVRSASPKFKTTYCPDRFRI